MGKTRAEIRKERDELWAKLRKPLSAKKEISMSKPSMKYVDGKPVLVYPWGQEMPAGMCEIYFWELLQDIRSGLTEETIDKYVEANYPADLRAAVKDTLLPFTKMVLEGAEKSVEQRDKEREEDIREVRRATEFYKDEGTTEADFEGDDE